MKLKKTLSGVLAAAMVVSLTPAMAFATTTNTAKSVPTVSANKTIATDSEISFEVKDAGGWDADKEQTIKLTFGNAEWETKPLANTTSLSAVMQISAETSTGASIGIAYTDVVATASDSVEFTFKNTDKADKGSVVTLKFLGGKLKTGSENGEVTISVDGLDSYVSSGTLTIATVGGGRTTATVTGSVKTYTRSADAKTVEGNIEIRETAVNAITGDQIIKLTLPKGFSWDVAGTKFEGNLLTSAAIATTSAVADTPAELKTWVSTTPGSITNGESVTSADGRSLYTYLKINPDPATREVIIVKPSITISKTASEGDIAVDLSGYYAKTGDAISDASDLVIAKYGSEAVVVKTADEEDIPTIYSGFVQTSKDKYNWIQLTFKESTPKSLESGRYIDVTLPEEVQVVTTENIHASLDKNADIADAKTYPALTNSTDYDFDSDTDRSYFSLIVPSAGAYAGGTWSASKAMTWSVFVPVTVEADFTGDITASVTGAKAGIEDTDLVVAKAESVVTVEASSTEVKNGVQKQAVSDITITENVAGYMDDNTTLAVRIDNLGLTGALVFDDADVNVTAGDLELNKTSIKAGTIYINIKTASTKPSTIEITNATATLNRTLPEGPYDLLVGEATEANGKNALIDNEAYNDEDFDVAPVTVEKYINIVTPAESTTVSEKVDAKFVIGEASYTNNGAATEMDAAAYIDSHNRTMVPIRYVANACGISENDIRWEAGSQTAIINGLNTVVTVKMGSNKLQTSTGEITMDTVAVNNNGRIYVPVRYIANALGANVSWDAATKTVTLTK